MTTGGLAETRSSGGQVLGRYRIVRRLAQGGMGVVYLGRLEGAAGFAKPVVIKRVIPDIENLEETTARFVREAQILSNLQHPGIVGVLDFGEEVGGHCMVLEYIHGYDLSKWLKFLQMRATAMPWEHSVFIMLRVLEALSYAHGFRRSDGMHTEVLHRDVSPGNIILDMEGRVRLADFGIACMDEGEPGQFKTQAGVLKGKVAFLAPELFAGTPPSASSDVYACAVVLYQMLAGRNPFSAENESRVMWRLITEPPTPLSECRDDLPVELQTAVLRALEKEPEARFESADALAQQLRRTLSRSESDIGRELRERLREDFTGDLPEMLRMEPLASRDMAWRTGTGMTSVAPSLPPGSFREAIPAYPTGPSLSPHTTVQDWSVNSDLPPRPIAIRAPGEANSEAPSSHSSHTMTSLGTALPKPPATERSTGIESAPEGRPLPPPRRSPVATPVSAGNGVSVVTPRDFDATDGMPTASRRLETTDGSEFGPSTAISTDASSEADSSSRQNAALPQPRGNRFSRRAAGLQMKHVVGIALSVGFTVAATMGGVQLLLSSSNSPPSPGRYILVEGADAPTPASPPPARAMEAAVQDAPNQKKGPAGPTTRLEASPPPPVQARAKIRHETDAATVSRQFGRKHKELQRCFERHASDIEGHPQIAVKFDVASTGKVRSVRLAPSALETTLLGRCLLQSARSTKFSQLKKSIRFTIPIQARAVKR